MSAALDAIEAAMFARLQTLAGSTTLTTSLPFRTIARWAGEVTSEDLDEGHLGVCPSALLAHEGSQTVSRGDLEYVETLGHDVEVVERHLFRVYVTVSDTRGDAATTKGGTGTPGIYACTQAVAEVLAGYRIAGLLDGGVVHLIERRPWRIRRGESRTDIVRFAAYAALPESSETLPGHPMTRLDATVTAPAPDVDNRSTTLAASRTNT
jgi:hypothetical protein